MGIFDFFKKKKEPKIDELVSSIMAQVFPNGKRQIQEIASSLYKDFRGKYPQESLMKSVAYCGSMLITAKDKSAQRIVDMGLLLKPDNKYTREDAITIYKSVVKSFFSTKFNIDNQEAFESFYKSLGNVGNTVEIENKRIKGAFGTYGVTLTNPVPIKGVQSSYTFLDSLLTNLGEPIQYKRLGSYGSSVTKELIDGYAISTKSGRSLGTIYICGYCNVVDPDPPVGFIIKGMPIVPPSPQTKPASYSGTIKPQTLSGSSVRPFTNSGVANFNRVIPTLINPPAMDTLLKKAKRADLTAEINTVFERNKISLKYDNKIEIRKLYDVFNDYVKYIKVNPLFDKQKEESHTQYIAENIKHFFKVGIAVYLVNNEYGDYIGRWSDQQYNMFINSLKDQSFTMYFDMLDSFDNCIDDIPRFDVCFVSLAEQFYREYKEECIKELDTICRTAYYAGFRYSLLKFGDEFLRPGIFEKDYGTFKVSQNICNALSHGYKNNLIPKEEFVFDEAIASQYKEVAELICRHFNSDLLDEKKFFNAISNGVSTSIHAGIEAVLYSIESEIITYLTEERIKSLANNKDFIVKHPYLEKIGLTDFQCDITNGSNILNVKDDSLKVVKMKDLCADSFLLGMTIALQTSKDKINIDSETNIRQQTTIKDNSSKQANQLSKREELAARLRSMANDPAMKTVERSAGAMCYSIQMPEEETYKCDHCGCDYNDTPENGVVRYFEDIRKMGYDCKLERWCRDCCIKEGFDVSKYSKSEYVLYIRLDSGEEYRRSDVSYYCLQALYHFLKNENMYSGFFGRTEFVGESTKTIERILGIKIK